METSHGHNFATIFSYLATLNRFCQGRGCWKRCLEEVPRKIRQGDREVSKWLSASEPVFRGTRRVRLHVDISFRIQRFIRKIEFFLVSRAQYHKISMRSFYARRSRKCKKDSQVVSLFYAFGIWVRKSCSAQKMLVKSTRPQAPERYQVNNRLLFCKALRSDRLVSV